MREAGRTHRMRQEHGACPSVFCLRSGVLTIVADACRWLQSEIYHPGGFGEDPERKTRASGGDWPRASYGRVGRDARVQCWAAVVGLPLWLRGAPMRC